MAKKEDKTNVMRLLDQKKIPYEHFSLENADGLSGEEIADKLSEIANKLTANYKPMQLAKMYWEEMNANCIL